MRSRVLVRVSQIEAELSLNLDAIAAAAELGLVNASYEIVGYGLRSPRFLANAPAPGRFDTRTLAGIEAMAQGFRDRYSKGQHRDELIPVPLQVQMYARPDLSPLDSARHTIFAMRRIAARNRLRDAPALGKAADVPDPVIRAVYRDQADVDDVDDEPSLSSNKAAAHWLNA